MYVYASCVAACRYHYMLSKEGKTMRIKITRKEFMREVMLSARCRWELREVMEIFSGYTWSDCLRDAWDGLKYRYEVIKPVKVKPVVVPTVERVADEFDLSFMYGSGLYNGD